MSSPGSLVCRHLSTALLLVLFPGSVAPKPVSAQAATAVRGGVLIMPDSTPAVDARITVLDLEGLVLGFFDVNSAGDFQIEGLPFGSYELQADMVGFRRSRQLVAFGPGEPERWDFFMIPSDEPPVVAGGGGGGGRGGRGGFPPVTVVENYVPRSFTEVDNHHGFLLSTSAICRSEQEPPGSMQLWFVQNGQAIQYRLRRADGSDLQATDLIVHALSDAPVEASSLCDGSTTITLGGRYLRRHPSENFRGYLEVHWYLR